MAKGNNQKLKLLYIVKIFSEKTDEEHGISIQELISLLNKYEVNADRKTLYQDFEELRRFGLEIESYKDGRNVYYHLLSRNFELPELKLLVDSVQASKFITEKKSNELIKKLESLVSSYEAKQLQRQVVLTGRVKAMNESIYYTVDKIHDAINEDRQITFQYFQWNVKKEQELRHDGAWYHISPWALVWADENYYLIGYDGDNNKIKHYRVDKMLKLEITEDHRQGQQSFKEINLPNYSKGLFGMFGGNPTDVTLLCDNKLAGPIIDRFGKEIPMIPVDETHFRTRVQVAASQQFTGWVIGLGKGIKVLGPESMVEAMRQEARRLTEQYN